jgi:hypothetical protein
VWGFHDLAAGDGGAIADGRGSSSGSDGGSSGSDSGSRGDASTDAASMCVPWDASTGGNCGGVLGVVPNSYCSNYSGSMATSWYVHPTPAPCQCEGQYTCACLSASIPCDSGVSCTTSFSAGSGFLLYNCAQ